MTEIGQHFMTLLIAALKFLLGLLARVWVGGIGNGQTGLAVGVVRRFRKEGKGLSSGNLARLLNFYILL